ncbi:MAG: glycosyltransferase [Promethearchaeota archaeon]
MGMTKGENGLTILALLNNALEDFILKGQSSWYPSYVNVDNIFKNVFVIYRYSNSRRAKAFGMNLIRVRKLPIITPLLMLFKTIKCIKLIRPSVVRAYNTQLEGFVAVLGQLLTRTPAIVSLHGDYDECVFQRGYPAHIRLAVHIIEKFVVRHARGVWCVTPYVADRAIKLGASRDRVKVIFNKVKIDKFKQAPHFRNQTRQKLGLSDEFTIIHTGRFNIQKNITTIIRAVALLKRKGNKVKLLLCGDDQPNAIDPPLRPILQAECRRLGIEKDVIFAGFIKNEELPAYYGAADAFVFAITGIGFGIVLVEAQAAGLPVVASDILYTKDRVVVDPNNSLLFNPTSYKELAKNLEKLMENPELRKRLSEASLASADRYDWERISKLEAEYYKDLIKK